MDREDSNTPARRVQRILGNSAFDRVSGPLRQSTLRPDTVSRDGASRSHQPAEELARAFPSIYRSTSAGTSTSHGIQSQAYPYNPQRSYTPSSSTGRRNRSSPYFNISTHNKHVKSFIKTVVLVDPDVDIVPKGKRRQQAYDDHCVVDMMEFRGDWSEADVISAIEDAFHKVLAPGASPK